MIKKIISIFTCIITLSSHAQDSGIEFFEGSWDDALYKANAYNKFIFVDAYASWCGPCKKMQSEVFPMENVGEFYNKNFIIFKNLNLNIIVWIK